MGRGVNMNIKIELSNNELEMWKCILKQEEGFTTRSILGDFKLRHFQRCIKDILNMGLIKRIGGDERNGFIYKRTF